MEDEDSDDNDDDDDGCGNGKLNDRLFLPVSSSGSSLIESIVSQFAIDDVKSVRKVNATINTKQRTNVVDGPPFCMMGVIMIVYGQLLCVRI
jgi:hypothetical protein